MKYINYDTMSAPAMYPDRSIKILLGLMALLASFGCLALPEDQYQPISIEADSATRREREGITTYEGNVEMSQGSMKVFADSITVTSGQDSNSTSLEATGSPATFQQQPKADQDIVHATARFIHYDPEAGKIELSGNAQLKQGDAEISSEKIVFLADEQIFKAEGAGTNQEGRKERVQIIIPARKKAPADTGVTP